MSYSNLHWQTHWLPLIRLCVVQIYCNWRWPTPIVLQHIDHTNPMGMKQWDPRVDYRDQSHLMPIITPAYPCMNSSYNVSDSTLRIMMVRALSYMHGPEQDRWSIPSGDQAVLEMVLLVIPRTVQWSCHPVRPSRVSYDI